MAKADQELAYIEGLNEIRRLLKPPDGLIAQPWKNAMTELAEVGGEAARTSAPRRTGVLHGKIMTAVQNKPIPAWAAVRSKARRKSRAYPRGYPYPRVLEYAARYGHMGWFKPKIQAAWRGRGESVLDRAAQDIGRNWRISVSRAFGF